MADYVSPTGSPILGTKAAVILASRTASKRELDALMRVAQALEAFAEGDVKIVPEG